MKSKLTVREAVESGFSYAGVKGEQYTSLTAIDSIDADSIATGKYFLASKESISPSTDPASLLDLISNEIDGQWYDTTHSDDTGVYEALAQLDLTDVTNLINEKLSKIWYRTITDIQLINQVS